MIYTATTEGVIVTAEPNYRPDHSDPSEGRYVFSYRILIENNSPYTVQLLKRHWIIFDSIGSIREIEGDGVIGEQPVLEPGESHRYESWCPLQSQMGSMRGWYTMRRVEDRYEIEVDIPRFLLVEPSKLN